MAKDKTVEVSVLLDGLSLTDEEKALVTAALNKPENLEVASRRYLRREEGSRLAQEAAAAKAEADRLKAEYEDKAAKEDAYHDTLAEYEMKLNSDREALEAEKTRYEAVLRTQGINPASALGQQLAADHAAAAATAAAAPKAPVYDREAMSKDFLPMGMAKTIADAAINLPLEVPAVLARYQALNGGSLQGVDWKDFQDKARANYVQGKGVMETAEELFGFKEKEAAIAEAALEAKIRAKVEDEMRAQYSNQSVPGGRPTDPDDKIFSKDFAEKVTVVEEGAKEDPGFESARDHFLQTNAELEKAGKFMNL